MENQFSREAEQSVLGGLLIDNTVLDIVLEKISGYDFYFKQHQIIFESILSLYSKNKPFDLLTIEEELIASNKLSLLENGEAYLYEMAANVASIKNIGAYAEIIKEKATRRQLIEIGTDVIDSAKNGRLNIVNILEDSQKRIFSLGLTTQIRNAIPMKITIKEIYDKLCSGEKTLGLMTG